MTIPASQLVQINPDVLAAAGANIALNGLCLTPNSRAPIGQVLSFASLAAVQTYFGASSAEAAHAAVYFGGFRGATKSPGAMLFAQYNTAAVAAYLRSASLSAMTLAQLQALSGSLTVTADGYAHVIASINFSAVGSFSAAAAALAAAFSNPGGSQPLVVTYDATAQAFVFTSGTTGATSTILAATGTLAAPLKLTAATGAVLSQGAAVAVPGAFMTAVVAVTRNWATFWSLVDPDGGSGFAQKLLFTQWVNSQNYGFAYIASDADPNPLASVPATSSYGYALQQGAYSGTFLLYQPTDFYHAPLVAGIAAAIDFDALNGRTTFAYRGQDGVLASVTDATAAVNLAGNPQSPSDFGNGYNFVGAYGTAAAGFVLLQRGTVSGRFRWMDSYINQIKLNNDVQSALMTFMQQMKSFPYNAAGYGLLQAAITDPINAALNFGSIARGVTLSESQKQAVNAAAGVGIDNTLSAQGWYLQILPAPPSTRQGRASPPIKLWYMDGQSIQAITFASINVQ